MSSQTHNITVSPMVQKLYPGFTKHKAGMVSLMVVAFVGETIDVAENETMDVLMIDSTASATTLLRKLVNDYHYDDLVPTIQEFNSYDVISRRSVPSSTIILRDGEL